MAHFFKVIDSPIGMLKLVANENRLAAILWEVEKDGHGRLVPMTEDPMRPILVKGARQLREYFGGQRTHFDLELDFSGTDFQKKVWQGLLGIPFGETRTYAELAEQLSKAKAARAVDACSPSKAQTALSMKKLSGHREQIPAPLTGNDLIISES